MNDLTLQQVMLRICAAALIVPVHGGVIAMLSWILGDRGPRDDGRFSVNPLRHADVVGGLLLVLFTFGWIRPIAIDPRKLRGGRASLVVIVIGAFCATLGVAALLRFVRPFVLTLLPDTAAATFFVLAETVSQLCVSFVLFNILSIPPLTGAYLLVAIWPAGQLAIRRSEPYGAALLCLLIVTGTIPRGLAYIGL